MAVLSGSANAGSPFDVRADRPAAESAYAALVRLVEQAQAHRAPFVRMADRYAGFFLPATLLIAGARVGDQRRPRPCAGGRRRRDAVPVDPGGADRARVRPLARRPLRRDRQGRRSDRDARRGAHRPVRQDRHAHGRNARRSRRRPLSRSPARRAARARRLGRPDVRARARRGARARRDRRGAHAEHPDRCSRGTRSGHRGRGRRSHGGGRQPRVHARRRDPRGRDRVRCRAARPRLRRGARARRRSTVTSVA